MTSNPNQDLIFFKNNSLISDDILRSNESYLSVISSLQGVSPNWLINSLIENSLQGTANLINRDLTRKQPNRSTVYFVSFTNDKEMYVKSLKKNGIDLSMNKGFEFKDCFSDLFIEKIKNPINAEQEVSELFDMRLESKSVLFIENPEILLYSTNISSNHLLYNISKLSKQAALTFIISSKDLINLDYTVSTSQDIGFKINDFLTKLYHKSMLNISLEPLKTGRAKDITGSITISRGSIPNLDVVEKEYVYNLTKDGNIKLYYR